MRSETQGALPYPTKRTALARRSVLNYYSISLRKSPARVGPESEAHLPRSAACGAFSVESAGLPASRQKGEANGKGTQAVSNLRFVAGSFFVVDSGLQEGLASLECR